MKSFEQFQADLREAAIDHGESFLKVYGVGKGLWIIDRVFPSRARSGGQLGDRYKKKGKAVKAAKKIARTTGEEVKIGRDWPKGGGPETLRAKKR